MYLVFDIGGTKLRLATSEDGENFRDPYIVETPKAFEDGMKVFAEGLQKISSGAKIDKAVGGIRGVLNKDKDVLLTDAHLTGWLGKPIKKGLQEVIKSQVFLQNDTALVGLGEAVRGAGKGYNILVYLTVSTGVGGARIINKQIDESSLGFEPGHQIIDADGSIFPDAESTEGGGVKGHLEAYISGTAVEKRYGKKPYEIVDEKIWDEEAKLLAVGINNTIVHWSPDVVVLGGSMMKSPGISVAAVKMHLSRMLKIFPSQPDVKKAELGDFGGLHGGLVYLQNLS